jgi:8-oxo-dGTP diphosphatase
MRPDGVVCYIRQNGRVLLQLKSDDRWGGGWWNGPGGKLLDGEAPEQAAIREVLEETGLTVGGLVEHGPLTFYFGDAAEPEFTIHIFSTSAFAGELQANDEGPLEWIAEDALPYEQMWPDDRVWLPQMLAGHRFRGVFRLSADHKTLLEHELTVET